MVVSVVGLACWLIGSGAAGAAQAGPTGIEGARDFRTAPVVRDGRYTDTILTGETLWFGVNLVNDDDQSLSVESMVVGGDRRDDLELRTALIGPTLTTVLEAAGDLSAEQFWYGDRNDGATWLWYLRFQLDHQGRFGEEYSFEFTVSGAGDFDAAPCDTDPGCVLGDRAAELRRAIAEIEEQIAAGDGQPAAAEVESLEAEISALAAIRDEPGASTGLSGAATPVILFALIVALVLANVGLFGSAGFTWLRKRAPSTSRVLGPPRDLLRRGTNPAAPGRVASAPGPNRPAEGKGDPPMDNNHDVRDPFSREDDEAIVHELATTGNEDKPVHRPTPDGHGEIDRSGADGGELRDPFRNRS